MMATLVSRFRHSYSIAAGSLTNVGTKETRAITGFCCGLGFDIRVFKNSRRGCSECQIHHTSVHFRQFAIRLSNTFCELRKVMGTGKLVIPGIAGRSEAPERTYRLGRRDFITAVSASRGLAAMGRRKMVSHGIWYARNELVKTAKC